MRPWHLRERDRYAKEKSEVEQRYHELHFSTENDQIKITGTLPIREGAQELDRFSIEILLLSDYPESIPEVFEVGGRIPRVLDRHCYEASGAACVLLPEERWKVSPKGSSLLSFIDGPVRNYFLSQAIFERDGVWPFGEWKHGFAGLQEYYDETFGTSEPSKVRRYLELLVAMETKGHWDCACGSGKRLRQCHREQVQQLRTSIPTADAKKAIERLDMYLHLRRRADVSTSVEN